MYLLPHAVNTQVDQALHTIGPKLSCLRSTEIQPGAVAALTLARGPDILFGWAFGDWVVIKPFAVLELFVSWVCE